MQISRSRGAGWAVGLVVTAALIVPVAGGIAAATEASAVPAKLVGVWSRNVTQANYNKYSPGGGPPVGVWTMAIKKGGVLDFYRPGAFLPNCKTCLTLRTRLYVAGARLTIPGWPPLCIGAIGVYGWKVSGRALTLKVIADKCGLREGLVTGTWKRK